MSRVLEFRAWDKLAETFVFADKGYQGHFILDLNGQFYNLQNGSGGNEYIVQQYTGLKDKNGKKIFEGDILMIEFHKNSEEPPRYYPIEFYQGSFCINCGSEDGCLMMHNGEYEVVGNIFQNPELIK